MPTFIPHVSTANLKRATVIKVRTLPSSSVVGQQASSAVPTPAATTSGNTSLSGQAQSTKRPAQNKVKGQTPQTSPQPSAGNTGTPINSVPPIPPAPPIKPVPPQNPPPPVPPIIGGNAGQGTGGGAPAAGTMPPQPPTPPPIPPLVPPGTQPRARQQAPAVKSGRMFFWKYIMPCLAVIVLVIIFGVLFTRQGQLPTAVRVAPAPEMSRSLPPLRQADVYTPSTRTVVYRSAEEDSAVEIVFNDDPHRDVIKKRLTIPRGHTLKIVTNPTVRRRGFIDVQYISGSKITASDLLGDSLTENVYHDGGTGLLVTPIDPDRSSEVDITIHD